MTTSTIPSAPPAPVEHRVSASIAQDIRREVGVRRHAKLPPGDTRFSFRNTFLSLSDPIPVLLDWKERYGPVFTIRTLHEPIVWALSPKATHQLLVSDADAFSWREGRFRDLHPLLGDGMLNIDGRHHQGARKLLLPGFKADHVAALTADVLTEVVAAADGLRPGAIVDMYAWTRDVAMRIALRALAGLDLPRPEEHELAVAFEGALAFFGAPFAFQALRGPGTPFARAAAHRRRLDAIVEREVAVRRASGDPGAGVLGTLIAATDDAGQPLPAKLVRDHLVTLLFAGHDTTTATLTFLLYELAHAPAARAALEAELDAQVPGGIPAADQLTGTGLPVLERTLAETLRKWPPAWVGPRQTVRDVTLDGVDVPAGVGVNYCSWATHHLPEVFEDPLAFDPDRFLPARAAAIPKGGYVPFGAGSRTCLGKRFGELELRALAAVLCGRLRFGLLPTDRLRVTTTPTLGPKGGLRFAVSARAAS